MVIGEIIQLQPEMSVKDVAQQDVQFTLQDLLWEDRMHFYFIRIFSCSGQHNRLRRIYQ